MTKQVRKKRGRPPLSSARDTRQVILDEALKLFASQGFVGTSVRQLAKAANLSESALYSHFENKQDVFEKLFQQHGPEILLLELKALSRNSQHLLLDESLEIFAANLIKKWKDPKFRLFTSLLIKEGITGPHSLYTSFQENMKPCLALLHSIFDRYKKRGEIAPHYDNRFLTFELIVPLAASRFVGLNANTPDSVSRNFIKMAKRHIRFFAQSVRPQ